MPRALAILTLLFAALGAAPAAAQSDGDAAELRAAHAAFVADRAAATSGLGPVPGVGFDAEYEGIVPMDRPELAERDAMDDIDRASATLQDPEPIGPLSFDPDAITDLPFGLTTVHHAPLLDTLEFFATDGRRMGTGWFARAGRWRAAIDAVADELGAPRDLVWVAAVESAFTNDAVSHAGAVGMWQFMQRTAIGRGMRIDGAVDDRLDPMVSTRFAIEYLLENHARFRSWPLAFAAYNAGGGHVRGEIRENNVTDFWVMDRYDCMYSDARRYALLIIALAVIDRNPHVFGYDAVVPEPPIAWDTIDVEGGTRLTLVAEAIDVPVETLEDLNPSLRRPATPDDPETWSLRVPPGTGDDFADEIADVIDDWGGEHELVPLRFGETIDEVADRYGMSASTLRAINGLGRREHAPYGIDVIVPTEGRGTPRGSGDDDDDDDVVLLPATAFAPPGTRRVFYEVHDADRLADIAAHFDVDLWELSAWNDLDPRAAIWSGMTLQVFVDADRSLDDSIVRLDEEVTALRIDSPEYEAWREAEERQSQRSRRVYTVRSGDTVIGIARRFGVRPSDITRWNGLSDDDAIIIGQQLVVGR